MDIDINKYFPTTNSITSPRELKRLSGDIITQADVVSDIINEIVNNGKTDITLCAPVGTGKSIMGLWAALALSDILQKTAVYTSPLNTLVDQMEDNFGGQYVKTIKGREYEKCLSGAQNCSVGYCKQRKCSITKTVPRECGECTERECPCRNCIYTEKLRAFKRAKIGNTNFSIFMIGLSDAEIVIIDECDEVESFVRMNSSITIQENITSKQYSRHMERLEGIRDEAIADIELHDDNITPLEVKELIKRERAVNSIQSILSDYEKRKAWCVSNNKGGTTYQPIDVSKYLDSKLSDKIVIRMSATPYKLESSHVIEVDSTYPVKNRPWIHVPIGKMGRQYRGNTFDKIALFLNRLDGKTVVHCHSYAIADSIKESLNKIRCSKSLYLQVGSVYMDGYTRRDIISAFKASHDENSIMLSVNLIRGVDFPEDEICNNVIVKQPWLNPTDELVKAKNGLLRTTNWQNAEIANTIMQAYGRLPRRAEKKSICYILDTDFNDDAGRGITKNWFDGHKELFYNWFIEAEGNYVGFCERCGKLKDYISYVKYENYKGMVCTNCNLELNKMNRK
jgi:hypothetical protein